MRIKSEPKPEPKSESRSKSKSKPTSTSTSNPTASLIERVQTESPKEVDRYLRHLARQPGDQLSEELAQRDAKQMTPLHIATQKADLAMVKVLLSFDASVDAKINGKTVEDFAKELADSKSAGSKSADSKSDEKQQSQHKQVYALIKSRGRWQSIAARNQGILFSRSIKSIEDAIENIRGAKGKNGVLFLGITGEGKSTFINYLCGVNYETEMVRGKRRVKPVSGSEVAPVGASTSSETLLPQVVEPKAGSYVLIDLPGFEDTRGTAEEICAAASIGMLTKQLNLIQGILLITCWNSLEDARMVSYRKAAHNVGAMISLDPKTAENVILVVTKPVEGLTEEDVRARLEDLAKDEKWSQSDKKEDVRREDQTDDMWKKQCLRKTTEAILDRENNIILADVTQLETRVQFQKLLESYNSLGKKPDKFDFKSYSRFMTQFVLVMENMIVNYNHLARQQRLQAEKIEKLRSSVSEVENEYKQLTASIEKFEKQKSEPFTEESFNKSIQEEKQKLSALRKRMLKSKDDLQQAQTESMLKAAQLGGIETDGEKLIEVVHRDWVCESTEAREETEVKHTGRKVFVPELGGCAEIVEVGKRVIPAVEKTVSEPVRYSSPVPIQRYVDKSRGGSFTAGGFTPGSKELSGTFTSSRGARGSVLMSVEVYGNTKDFPATKERIDRLEQESKAAQTRLEAAKRDMVSEDEVDESYENLRKIELEKIAAVGNHEKTKAICEMQINLLAPQLEAAKKKSEELKQQLSPEQEELSDIALQIEVNAELFAKLREIIQIMGFRSEVIDNFMDLSKDITSGATSAHAKKSAQTDLFKQTKSPAKSTTPAPAKSTGASKSKTDVKSTLAFQS